MIPAEAKLTAESLQFAEAWQRWRGDELVPRRATVRIEDIAPLLPYLSLLEYVSPELVRFRLAGTALYDAKGIELTGKNFIDMAAPEGRARRIERTSNIFEQPCGAYAVFPMLHSSGRLVRTEVLSLPVWPNDPSALQQIFTVSIPLPGEEREGMAAPRSDTSGIHEFYYVDIGAGIPASDRPQAFPRTAAQAR